MVKKSRRYECPKLRKGQDDGKKACFVVGQGIRYESTQRIRLNDLPYSAIFDSGADKNFINMEGLIKNMNYMDEERQTEVTDTYKMLNNTELTTKQINRAKERI